MPTEIKFHFQIQNLKIPSFNQIFNAGKFNFISRNNDRGLYYKCSVLFNFRITLNKLKNVNFIDVNNVGTTSLN